MIIQKAKSENHLNEELEKLKDCSAHIKEVQHEGYCQGINYVRS